MKTIKYILAGGNLFLFISGERLICRYSEDVMQGRQVSKIMNKETLTSKIVMELKKLD